MYELLLQDFVRRSPGGLSTKSRASAAYSGAREEITWSNFDRWAVTRLQANWASTCANHISGSEGQNAGSLRLTVTAEMSAAAGILDSSVEASSLSTDIASSMFGHQGHQ